MRASPSSPSRIPSRACKVYGNVALRVFHDLDVFIHEGDVARATEILRTQGYTLIPRIDGIGEALEVAIAHDRLFAKDPASYSRVLADRAGPFDFANDRAGTLELHWDFSLGRQLSITRNNEQLWARAREGSRRWHAGMLVLSGGQPSRGVHSRDDRTFLAILEAHR